MTPRRGWREKHEPGVYRAHLVACPASTDRIPRRRCACPYQLVAPGTTSGTTRTVTFYGSGTDAGHERRRLAAEGVPRPPDPTTLHEFSITYLRTKSGTLSPHTIETTARDYRLHVHPALGAFPVEAITRQVVQEWLAALTRRATSRRMIVGAVAALRVILSMAVEWDRIPTNPAKGLRLPAPDVQDHGTDAERVLTLDQLHVLTASVTTDPRRATMFRAAGEAGLRRGEVIGLKWPDVDLKTGQLHVRRNLVQTGSKAAGTFQAVERVPKSRQRRTVAITPTFARCLGDHFARSVIEGGADASGFVWPGKAGGPMNEGTPSQAVARALKTASLVDADGRPLCTFHGLRHTCATAMLTAGIPLITVSRFLGHADPSVTAQVYAHLVDPTQFEKAAAVFEEEHPANTLRETLREDS